MKKNIFLNPVFCLITLLILFFGTGAAQVLTKINHNIDIYFAPNNPAYVLDQRSKEYFPDDDFYLFLFEGDDLFSDSFLKPFVRAVEDAQALDNLDRVLTLTTYDHIEGSADGFKTAPLFDERSDFDLSVEQRAEKILSDRFARDAVVSRDGKAIGLILRPMLNTITNDQIILRDNAKEIFDKYGLSSYLTAVSGPSEMVHAQLMAMFDSLQIFLPLATAINAFILILMFPRFIAISLSMLVIGLSVQTPVLFLNMAGADFTMIHTLVPSLMVALCVALLIHYLNKVKHYSNMGMNAAERSVRARDDIKKPAFFAALTTAAGMGSLAFSPIPPIQTFGWISAIGILSIFVYIIFLLPPILGAWDKDTPWKQGSVLDRILNAFTKKCARFAIRRAGWVLLLAGVLLGIGVPQIMNVRVETDVFKFFSESHYINKDTHHIEDVLSGTTTIDVIFETEKIDAFKEPENLKYMLQMQHWMESLPEVDITASAAEMVEEMHWAFNAEDDAYRKIPDNSKLVNQYLFIYDGIDLYEFVNYDFNQGRISLNLNVHEVGKIDHVVKSIEAYVQKNPLPGFDVKVTGFGTLYINLSQMVTRTQVMSLLATLGVIFVFMIMVFRSFGSGLLCMVPNCSPVLLVFILMGVFNIWLDVGTAMVASIGVGIAVDDTIHLYHAYISRRRKGHGAVLSLMRAYRHAGLAVTCTTFVLALQFLSIALSDFLPTKNFGLLSAIGITSALIFDLLVLPALIVVIAKLKKTV